MTALLGVALAAGLLSAGVSAGQTTSGGSGPSTSSGPSGTTQVVGNHFTCYRATASTATTGVSTFDTPPFVELFNQFVPQGLWTALGKVALHCNPVTKTVLTTPGAPGSVYSPPFPNAHLLCFSVDDTVPGAVPVVQPSYKVAVSNQFGTEELDTGQPVVLCLPSWKSLTGPPENTQIQPPNVSHYLCYTVAKDPNSPTSFAPPPITLQDQFMPSAKAATVLTPTLLCLPTLKQVDPLTAVPGTATAGSTDATLASYPHLLCYTLKIGTVQAPPFVFDQNQFGTGQVVIGGLRYLCVPSVKTVVSTGTGQIVISKFDAASLVGLSGGVFTVTNASNAVVGTCTTGATGTCTVSGLPAPAGYTVTETTPPPGYSLPSPPSQPVVIPTSPGSVAVSFADSCLVTETPAAGCIQPLGT